MAERFVARAVDEGISLRAVDRASTWHLAFGAPLAVFVVALVAMFGWKQIQLERGDHREYAAAEQGPRVVGNPGLPRGGPFTDHADARLRAVAKVRRRPVPQTTLVDLQSGSSFMTPPSWARTDADVSGFHPSLIESEEMAPSLSAWLARMNPLAELNSFNAGNACDPTEMEPNLTDPGNVQSRPVFCFDPKITLVADSSAHELFKPHWQRTIEPEGASAFRFATTSRAITH